MTKTVLRTQPYNSINLRLSHPNLYRSIMTFAMLSIALGLNFLLTKPTFNPYNIPYWIIGVIFVSLGSLKIVFLNAWRNLRLIRYVMAGEVAFMIFWGTGTSITFFQGKTSLQLFILYVGMAVFEVFLMIEPFFNPMTAQKDEGGERV
jgi:hypothetical protein